MSDATVVNGPQRRTEICADYVVQYKFVDGRRRLVAERITTHKGRTHAENFDPPLREKDLPGLPLKRLAYEARMARLAGLGISQRKKPKRRLNDRRSRICRLREALNK